MKKLLAYAAGVALLFTMGVNAIMAAAPPPFESPIIPLDCSVLGTCAVYVNDEVYMGPPDGSKSSYFMSITDAVSKVKSDSDYNTIIIAEGTYDFTATPETMPFEFSDADSWGTSKGIYIYGGYDNDFNERDKDLYPTIIDADSGANNVFKVENLGGRISGVEITGVSGSNSAPIVVDNTGGAAGNFIIEYNSFYGNSMGLGADGVAVYVSGSNTAEVYENYFTDNTGALNSVASVEGDVEFHNNLMVLNTTWTGIACTDGALVYNNFVLSGDHQKAINAWGDCDVYNNSVIGNDISAGSTFGAIVMSGNNNNVANNLIAGNAGNQSFYHDAGDTSTFEYNALFDNGSDPSEGSLTDGNVLCDPLFDNISFNEAEDAQLGEGSECIDAGKVISAVTDDYFGTSRPLGDGYDPGAHEAPASVAPSPGAPVISGLSVAPSVFNPDDGETTAIAFNVDVNSDVTILVLNDSAVEIRKIQDNVAQSAGSVLDSWDGKNDLSQIVDDGTYTVKVVASNVNGSDEATDTVVVDTSGLPVGECAGYSDVPAAHPKCDAIEYMQSIGAMTGNPDGTFEPDELLQRDQVAKVVLETFSLFDGSEDYCAGNDPFPDVPSSQWSYQYICRGVDLGMITGYLGGEDAGMYKPARAVNRVEFLALTLRNLAEAMPGVNSSSYNDVVPGEWYAGYAKFSYDNSLFMGNNLFPAQFTKRAEVAEVIYKLHNLGKI